ncbi:MAG: hypothetical protein C6I01_00065 [Epsilonproteobacteria bacterium]|nr:hypothetical protein [Campylobacterota bacterium]
MKVISPISYFQQFPHFRTLPQNFGQNSNFPLFCFYHLFHFSFPSTLLHRWRLENLNLIDFNLPECVLGNFRPSSKIEPKKLIFSANFQHFCTLFPQLKLFQFSQI